MGERHENDVERLRGRRRARAAQIRRRRRLFTGVALALAIAAAVAIAVGLGGSGSGRGARAGASSRATTTSGAGSHPRATGTGVPRASSGSRTTASQGATRRRGGRSGSGEVPILMYHVINEPPAGAPFPGLYVPATEFAEQMHSLAAAGFHAVTMDQLRAHWLRDAPLPGDKPVVLTFDNGYRTQYTAALPILRSLGWVGDENLQLSGLPPSQGGLSGAQVRAMVAAGWELDTQGYSHADLIAITLEQLHFQVAVARRTLQREYGVPVDWFCYPSGHYDQAVVEAVRSAGYVGSTTVVPGWAKPGEDPYRLPRLRVLGGTGGRELVSEIEAIRGDSPPPATYSG